MTLEVLIFFFVHDVLTCKQGKQIPAWAEKTLGQRDQDILEVRYINTKSPGASGSHL
jgi:hypothetical protein